MQLKKVVKVELPLEIIASLEEIRSRYGFAYITDAIKLCIVEHHRILFPPIPPTIHMPAKVKKIADQNKTPAEKEVERQATKNAKKAIKDSVIIAELTALATDPYPAGLCGQVFQEGDKPIVQYYSYFERGRDLNHIPLTQVTKDLIEIQYQPSYEEVKRLQALGKIDYQLN